MGLLDKPSIPKSSKKKYRNNKAMVRSDLYDKGFRKAKTPPRYKDYIKSKRWRARRNEFCKSQGRVCAACDEKRYLDVHHMDYSHLGNERDEDLVVLCRNCHSEYHETNGTQRDMISLTVAFIEAKRQLSEAPRL